MKRLTGGLPCILVLVVLLLPNVSGQRVIFEEDFSKDPADGSDWDITQWINSCIKHKNSSSGMTVEVPDLNSCNGLSSIYLLHKDIGKDTNYIELEFSYDIPKGVWFGIRGYGDHWSRLMEILISSMFNTTGYNIGATSSSNHSTSFRPLPDSIFPSAGQGKLVYSFLPETNQTLVVIEVDSTVSFLFSNVAKLYSIDLVVWYSASSLTKSPSVTFEHYSEQNCVASDGCYTGNMKPFEIDFSACIHSTTFHMACYDVPAITKTLSDQNTTPSTEGPSQDNKLNSKPESINWQIVLLFVLIVFISGGYYIRRKTLQQKPNMTYDINTEMKHEFKQLESHTIMIKVKMMPIGLVPDAVDDDGDNMCYICKQEFKVGDTFGYYNCCLEMSHYAHVLDWHKKKPTCPFCRRIASFSLIIFE